MSDELREKSGGNAASFQDHSERQDITITKKVAVDVMSVAPFGKYNLIGKLGHGGMAEVFLAYVAGPPGFVSSA